MTGVQTCALPIWLGAYAVGYPQTRGQDFGEGTGIDHNAVRIHTLNGGQRIGINVNATEFPEEIRDKATSLKLELGRSVKRSDVICAVAESFEEYYEIFEKTCDMSGLLSAYDEMLVNMEKTVCVLDPKGEYRGKALGIDEEGCLLVEKENGEVVHVLSGEVSVRGIYGYV